MKLLTALRIKNGRDRHVVIFYSANECYSVACCIIQEPVSYAHKIYRLRVLRGGTMRLRDSTVTCGRRFVLQTLKEADG
jgi:hypothetical protein